jgi:hypothetical protein
MNTQAAATQQAPVIVPNTHTATLVRGESYFLGNTRFEPGVAVPIPQYIKDHLESTAVDMVDVEGEAEGKQKFKFATLPADGKAEAPARVRGRRTATQAAQPAEADSEE